MAIWEELLFGSGFWLGLLLIEVILFIIAILNKYGSFFSAIFSMIMFIVYYQELYSINDFVTYGMLLMALSSIIFIFMSRK